MGKGMGPEERRKGKLVGMSWKKYYLNKNSTDAIMAT